MNGVVREARVGVSVFLIDVTEDLDGRSFIVPKVNEENDMLDSVPGDSPQVKLAAIDALLVGANISVKLAGAGRDPGTIRSKKVKDLFVVSYGNKEIETLDSDELDKIVTPFGQKGPVEKNIEELEGDCFRMKWRKQVEEEVVSIEDLADSVIWEYRLAQRTTSTSHPQNSYIIHGVIAIRYRTSSGVSGHRCARVVTESTPIYADHNVFSTLQNVFTSSLGLRAPEPRTNPDDGSHQVCACTHSLII